MANDFKLEKPLGRIALFAFDNEIDNNQGISVQVLSMLQLLGIDEKVNTRGGALALGHPLGASGARVATTLLYGMRDTRALCGIASLCIGQGPGAAKIFENFGI